MNTEKNFIKSPLNYIGGKFKLLPQLLPLFPNDTKTFVDVFGGGFNVGINTDAEKVIYNDLSKEVKGLLEYLSSTSLDTSLEGIRGLIKKYSLSKTNKEGYLSLRERYNKGDRHPIIFYTLVVHAFNNQIRFNSKGEFNMPFGKDRSSFNPSLEKKFIDFVRHLQELDVEYYSKDFRNLPYDTLDSNDFLYFDPPYLITTASYNENGGWSEKNELELLELLDLLDSKGLRFALSNVLTHKGNENRILKEWSKKYNTHLLDYNYKHVSYHGKNTDKVTQEVLVTNY